MTTNDWVDAQVIEADKRRGTSPVRRGIVTRCGEEPMPWVDIDGWEYAPDDLSDVRVIVDGNGNVVGGTTQVATVRAPHVHSEGGGQGGQQRSEAEDAGGVSPSRGLDAVPALWSRTGDHGGNRGGVPDCDLPVGGEGPLRRPGSDGFPVARVAPPQITEEKIARALESAWDEGNAMGLDGYIGPERGEEPDPEAIRARNDTVDRLTAALGVQS